MTSFLIHGFFYFLIQLEVSTSIIDNPIVSVSYFEPEKNKTQPSGAKPILKSNAVIVSNENKNATQDQSQVSNSDHLDSGETSTDQAFESQSVSEKPRVLYQEKVAYPAMAKNARIEGPVKLSVTIDKLGQVIDVTVLEGPGYGLNETAVTAMKNFKFSPAQKEGQSVPVRITYIYRFKLESR